MISWKAIIQKLSCASCGDTSSEEYSYAEEKPATPPRDAWDGTSDDPTPMTVTYARVNEFIEQAHEGYHLRSFQVENQIYKADTEQLPRWIVLRRDLSRTVFADAHAPDYRGWKLYISVDTSSRENLEYAFSIILQTCAEYQVDYLKCIAWKSKETVEDPESHDAGQTFIIYESQQHAPIHWPTFVHHLNQRLINDPNFVRGTEITATGLHPLANIADITKCGDDRHLPLDLRGTCPFGDVLFTEQPHALLQMPEPRFRWAPDTPDRLSSSDGHTTVSEEPTELYAIGRTAPPNTPAGSALDDPRDSLLSLPSQTTTPRS